MIKLTYNEKSEKYDYWNKYVHSGDSSAATMSEVDPNSNIASKSISTMQSEFFKAEFKQSSLFVWDSFIKKIFGNKDVINFTNDWKNDIIYLHDLDGVGFPYCSAIDIKPFIDGGTKTIGGVSRAPKHLNSFCGSYINLMYGIAGQFKGAIADVSLFTYFDYFARKDYGEDYLTNHEHEIKQQLQLLIYTLNEPSGTRGNQSIFYNTSIFDKYYWNHLFSERLMPDDTFSDYESVNKLQWYFMDWFTEERSKELLTFPVITCAYLKDENGKAMDEDFVKNMARTMAKGNSFFIYNSDSIDSLASCCLTGDTKIKCVDGVRTIRDMELECRSNPDKVYYVVSSTPDGPKLGKLTSPRITKITNQLIKIVFDNDKELRCTPDHKIMLRSGKFIQAKDLKVNDSIMPLYYGYDDSWNRDKQGGKEWFYSNDKGYYTHRFVYSEFYNDQNIKGFDIHHVDFDGKNNNPNNLQKLSHRDHTLVHNRDPRKIEITIQSILGWNKLTREEKAERLGHDPWSGDWIEKHKNYWKKDPYHIHRTAALKYGKWLIDNNIEINEPNYSQFKSKYYKKRVPTFDRIITIFESLDNFISQVKMYNHKVKSIEILTLDEPIPVYDATVEGYGNFPIDLGDNSCVYVHNCRLKNELDMDSGMEENQFSYTLGGTGLQSGSKKVITINFNRLGQMYTDLKKDDYKSKGHQYCIDTVIKSLSPLVQRVHRYLTAYNELLWEEYDNDILPVYKAGYISLDKQYLTIGVNSLLELAEWLGYEIKPNSDYVDFLAQILASIKKLNKVDNKLYSDKTGHKVRFNTEFVPYESGGVRMAKKDKEAGLWVPRDCYNSYFYVVENDDLDIFDKADLYCHKVMDSLDGGSAYHMNLAEIPDEETWIKIIDYMGKCGCSYWTYNCLKTCCEESPCGYINVNTEDHCTKCGSKNISHATRVIGYLTKIKNWAEGRQSEGIKRHYHKV